MKKIMLNLEEVYCLNDNFVKYLERCGLRKHPAGRKSALSIAEYMTIILLKQELGIRKNSNLYIVIKEMFKRHFSPLPSYQQFNEGLRQTFPYLMLLTALMAKNNKIKKSKFYIVDSTPLPICSNGHRYKVKIDNGLAKSGKNLNGWFHGFKLHIIINNNLDIVSLCISDGAKKDYNVLSGEMVRGLFGWLVGDKGYVSSKTHSSLSKQGLTLLTKTRSNMKKFPATSYQNYLFSKREIVETVFSVLKHQLNIVTNNARSFFGFFSQVFAAILAYFLCKDKKLEKLNKIEAFQAFLIS